MDSLKSAQALLGGFGFEKKEIKELYEEVADGEFITFLVDPLDGRRSPIHRDIGGVELLAKEFADATKHRPPFPDVTKTEKKEKAKKKKKTTKKKSKEDL